MGDKTNVFVTQKDLKRLEIKLETLVGFLNVGGRFGPPHGREQYDQMVKKALADNGL